MHAIDQALRAASTTGYRLEKASVAGCVLTNYEPGGVDGG